MFREEIIDILNKNKPLRSGYDTYYFLYKINPDESLVKVDYSDIENMVNGIKGALSPYDIVKVSYYCHTRLSYMSFSIVALQLKSMIAPTRRTTLMSSSIMLV